MKPQLVSSVEKRPGNFFPTHRKLGLFCFACTKGEQIAITRHNINNTLSGFTFRITKLASKGWNMYSESKELLTGVGERSMLINVHFREAADRLC